MQLVLLIGFWVDRSVLGNYWVLLIKVMKGKSLVYSWKLMGGEFRMLVRRV